MYLQQPPGSERLTELARTVNGVSDADSVGMPSGTPILEQAQRLETYLKRNYRYTLDVQAPGQLSAIDDFLFEQKAGYCEYYATAMVLMLRGLGIPTRMVSGFLQGEWNEFGQYFTVRQQDAHTWVEVYFPRSGWYPFDPTPAVSQEALAMMGRVRQLFDTLWLSWDRYILRFSKGDQVAALREIRQQSSALQSRSGQWLNEGKAMAAIGLGWLNRHRELLLLSLAVACFVFLALRTWAQRHGGWLFLWKNRPLRPVQLKGQSFYTKLLRRLASKGLQKLPSQTAAEFLQAITPKLGPLAGAMERLTAYYHQLRFGNQSLTEMEYQEISQLLGLIDRTPLAAESMPGGAEAPSASS